MRVTHGSSRRGLAVVVACAAMLFVAVAIPAGSWSRNEQTSRWSYSAPDACPEIFLLGARGSGQKIDDTNSPFGMGVQIDTLFSLYVGEMQSHRTTDSKRRVGVAPFTVPPPGYPAVSAPWPPTGKRLLAYKASVHAGVDELIKQLGLLSARCGPTTHFVLAGFSQGAHVVHLALDKVPEALLNRPGFDGDSLVWF